MHIVPNTTFNSKIRAYSLEDGKVYTDGNPYIYIQDLTIGEWWNATTLQYEADKPELADAIPASYAGEFGDWTLTIDPGMTVGRLGHAIRVTMVTTLNEAAEVMVASPKTFDVLNDAITTGEILTAIQAEGTYLKLIQDRLPASPATEGSIAALDTLIDALPAALKAEVVDALTVDAIDELTTLPASTPSLAQAIMLLYMALRNTTTTTAGTYTIHNDAGDAVITQNMTDDQTTFTRNKMIDA